MSLLDELTTFSILYKEDSSNEEDILSLKKFSPIDVPDEYLEVIREAANIEMAAKVKGYDCDAIARIWSAEHCIGMNKAYEFQDQIPGCLAIGDNTGSGVLFYLNGQNGFGVYIASWGNFDYEDAVRVSPSLRSLLVNHVGIEKLIDY